MAGKLPQEILLPESFSEFFRGKIFVFFENLSEINMIVKAALLGNVFCGFIGIHKHMLCGCQLQLKLIFSERYSIYSCKAAAYRVFGDFKFIRQKIK